eukprot:jgi/Galph1/3554/GphlegSOOS_G2221.1
MSSEYYRSSESPDSNPNLWQVEWVQQSSEASANEPGELVEVQVDGLETLAAHQWLDATSGRDVSSPVNLALDPQIGVASALEHNNFTSHSRTARLLRRRTWFWVLLLILVAISTSILLFFLGVPVVTLILSTMIPLFLLLLAVAIASLISRAFIQRARLPLEGRRIREDSRPTPLGRPTGFRSGSRRRNVVPLFEPSVTLASQGNLASYFMDGSELGVTSRTLKRFLEGISEGTIERLPTYIFSSKENGKNSSLTEESGLEQPKEDVEHTSNMEHCLSTATDENIQPFDDVEFHKEESGTLASGKLNCAVCLEPFQDGECLRILPCFHQFHTACIDPWLKRRGPYSTALVRQVAETFPSCVKDPVYENVEINLSLAREQHQQYCQLLRSLVGRVVEIPAEDQFPDCVFIEDTVVVIGGVAILTNPGHISRRGEVFGVEQALLHDAVQLKCIEKVSTVPVFLDGGDVLWTGGHLFVGVGNRTSQSAVDALQKCLPTVQVIPLQLDKVLHLKSVVTFIPEPTGQGDAFGWLVIQDTLEGHRIFETIKNVSAQYDAIWVPESEAYAANVLYCNKVVCLPQGYPVSTRRVASFVEPFYKVVLLDMSQFRIANGALTCSCVLF